MSGCCCHRGETYSKRLSIVQRVATRVTDPPGGIRHNNITIYVWRNGKSYSSKGRLQVAQLFFGKLNGNNWFLVLAAVVKTTGRDLGSCEKRPKDTAAG